MADESTSKAPAEAMSADKATESVAKADVPADQAVNKTDAAKAPQPSAEKAAKPVAEKSTKPAAKTTKPAADKAAKPAKAKKAKPPKLEDKPFAEFIEQHFVPAVKTALEKEDGLNDIQISFDTQPVNVVGVDKDAYPQVIGRWANGTRQFNIAFLEENIKGAKIFSFATDGATPSTIEQFMGDERKVSLDLMVLYIVRRLKGQKWLKGN